MGESIFKKIRKKIGRLFSKDQDPETPQVLSEPETCQVPGDQEIPEAAVPETGTEGAESGESISLDAPPAEDLESRWTQEYVQFLEETDGGLPQTGKGPEEEGTEAETPEEDQDPEGPACEEEDPEKKEETEE